jgi:excisionase family DNA binding protein
LPNCLNCKTKLPENAKFCPDCGAKAPEIEPVTQASDPLRGYPPVLEPKQVAEILGIGLCRLYEHFRAGDIPAKKLGRRWRISTRKFFEWLETAG